MPVYSMGFRHEYRWFQPVNANQFPDQLAKASFRELSRSDTHVLAKVKSEESEP